MEPGNHLFDRAAEYDAMLNRGLRLTGEGKEFYLEGRLSLLLEYLPAGYRPARILDYGCGTGESTAALAGSFPGAEITGVDTSTGALDFARHRNEGERVGFRSPAEIAGGPLFDLCYVNGVFHHIAPADRDGVLGLIRDSMAPGGLFAWFENNPLNPGTRWVMSRIPFDRDARLISPHHARRLLGRNGFNVENGARHLFFFPAPLRALRRVEQYLRWLPFGGQYMLLGTMTGSFERSDD